MDYGRESGFKISVNGTVATFNDIPGEALSTERKLDKTGPVRIALTIADEKQSVKNPGIVVKVGGKPIGRPSFFGLDRRDDIPQHLLKRLYGEVDANELTDDVTADWGAIVENSAAYQELEAFVESYLVDQLSATFRREFSVVERHMRIDKSRTSSNASTERMRRK